MVAQRVELPASTRDGIPRLCSHATVHYAPMPKRSTFSGDVAQLPIHLQRALSVDRSYYSRAICRTPTDTPKLAWTAERTKRYEVNGQQIPGPKLIQMAVMVCKSCPVQWRCAEAAIEAGEPVGTWGAPIEDIEWLSRRPNWRRILDHAQVEQVDVATTIRRLRSPA